MVEMSETANILNNATARGLVILDEIGRGTSTFDGLSLAWSIVEHLHNAVGAKTLFATHYHELTELAGRLPRVQNFNVAVREWNDQIVFLRKIAAGATDKSYGIQVARLAGVPKGGDRPRQGNPGQSGGIRTDSRGQGAAPSPPRRSREIKKARPAAADGFVRMKHWFLSLALALAVLPAHAHKVQVSDPAAARALVAQGGRLIADYGGYQLIDTAQTNGLVVRDIYNSILLQAGRLDTSEAQVQSLRQPAGIFPGRRLHLVQFAGPVQPAWRQALLDARLQIVNYIPHNAYLVYGDARALAQVQALPAARAPLQWDGRLPGGLQDQLRRAPGRHRPLRHPTRGRCRGQRRDLEAAGPRRWSGAGYCSISMSSRH